MPNRRTANVLLALTVVIGLATACETVDGNPTAAESATTSSKTVTTSSRTPSATTRSEPTPTGAPIGNATMAVRGGTGPVTIRYRINGEAEQTEANVTLPWEKQYPVYDKVQTSVTADGGDAELICTIIMDGNLVSYVTEPRPKCSFAYYG